MRSAKRDYNDRMSTRTAEYKDAIEHLPDGSTLTVSGVSWEEYEDLLDDLADRPPVRVSYDEGTLEIMSPLPEHERYKEFISYLVRAFADDKNLPLEGMGSTTWKRPQLRKGAEADTCFYVTNAHRIVGKPDIDLAVDPPPDVVVEIDTTNRSHRKLAIYAALHVPEIWRYDGKQLEMYVLQNESYVKTASSASLIGLSASLVTEFLEISKTRGQTEALRLFRERI
jgi:Uma2 family endonuclease